MFRKLAYMILFSVPLATSAYGHKTWLRASQTVLSGDDAWVTVDAAVSNDLFYFNHFPLQLDGLVVIAPNGERVQPENISVGKYRSVFDVPLTQQGTYRIAVENQNVMATWEVDGQSQRYRGDLETLQKKLPPNATQVQVSENLSRIETYVTRGGLTLDAMRPTGTGIQWVAAKHHPNDLYSGETARVQFLLDGKPASNLPYELILGETRYRTEPVTQSGVTDSQGEFSVDFSQPGMYWLSSSVSDLPTSVPGAKSRRSSYSVTLEVLPQ